MQTIHSVHPESRGSPMHSGQLLQLTPSSVGPPAQMIHSVYPVSRGSHHTLRLLTPANSLKCGAPCADDTLGASRAHRAHLMLQLVPHTGITQYVCLVNGAPHASRCTECIIRPVVPVPLWPSGSEVLTACPVSEHVPCALSRCTCHHATSLHVHLVTSNCVPVPPRCTCMLLRQSVCPVRPRCTCMLLRQTGVPVPPHCTCTLSCQIMLSPQSTCGHLCPGCTKGPPCASPWPSTCAGACALGRAAKSRPTANLSSLIT